MVAPCALLIQVLSDDYEFGPIRASSDPPLFCNFLEV